MFQMEVAVAREQLFVVLHQGQWKISHAGKHTGVGETQQKAIRAAGDTAQSLGLGGYDAQVLVQGENNQFRAEWTYGHDPYPPPG